MRADRIDPVLTPDWVLKPVLIPQTSAHRLRRGIQTDGMSASFERQEVAVRAGGVVEDCARASRVVQSAIRVSRDDEERSVDVAQSFRSPRSERPPTSRCHGNY